MSSQAAKQPPAFVVVDGDLFHRFDRWRKLERLALTEVAGTDGWMLRLTRPEPADDMPRCPGCGAAGVNHFHEPR